MRIEQHAGTYRVERQGHGARLRVAVLCSDDPQHDYLRRAVGRRLDLVAVVVEPSTSQQRTLWRRGRYLDWAARAYQTLRQRFTGRARYRRAYFQRLAIPAVQDHPLVVGDINADAVVALLRRVRPHVTVVCGTRYLSRSVRRHGGLMINLHGGHLPEYKGNHCVFFAFARGDFERLAGTLHLVSAALDGGDIVEVVKPAVFPHDNDEHLYSRCLHAMVIRVVELLVDLEAGTGAIVTRRQPPRGHMFRHRDRLPHRDLSLWLRRRLGLHQVPLLPQGPVARELPAVPVSVQPGMDSSVPDRVV